MAFSADRTKRSRTCELQWRTPREENRENSALDRDSGKPPSCRRVSSLLYTSIKCQTGDPSRSFCVCADAKLPRAIGGQFPSVTNWFTCAAGGGARTHTILRSLDFESSASANSATPALGSGAKRYEIR